MPSAPSSARVARHPSRATLPVQIAPPSPARVSNVAGCISCRHCHQHHIDSDAVISYSFVHQPCCPLPPAPSLHLPPLTLLRLYQLSSPRPTLLLSLSPPLFKRLHPNRLCFLVSPTRPAVPSLLPHRRFLSTTVSSVTAFHYLCFYCFHRCRLLCRICHYGSPLYCGLCSYCVATFFGRPFKEGAIAALADSSAV